VALAGAVLVAALTTGAPRAQDFEANLVTGEASGTDFRIGGDIAAVAADCGLTLNVRESAGSLENMAAVRDRRVTQLGIVQSDVLEYFRTFQADDAEIARMADGVRIAFPLYGQEVHVLARRDIARLADLAGRRVAVGDADSGTFVTAGLILDLASVAPAERVALGGEAALEALLAGEVDALFDVVGAPAERFRSELIDPEAYHLVPLTEPVLHAVYAPAEIAAGTYGFVDAPVASVSVQAVLVTYDYDPDRNAYHAASCGLVSDVSHLIVTRLDRLRAEGHPKWRSVDMTALPPGWQVSQCVLNGLAPGYAFTCLRPDGTVEQEGSAVAPGGGPNQVFLERICERVGC
jgi:TRAP transporter TAXI family solute receptor